MANDEHVAILKKGVAAWNEWRKKNRSVPLHPDLSGADLTEANLNAADLSGANLQKAYLLGTFFIGANLSGAKLNAADLIWTDFTEADLSWADFKGAKFDQTKLVKANLSGANLQLAMILGADFRGANLTGCSVYGVSAWGLKLEGAKQQNLVITHAYEPEITVDNIEVAQFIYLLLHNEKIRDVIDTIGKKGVLLLGRFTAGRIKILERLRDELRKRDFLPIIFNFDKPETKNFTETVRLLAGMSRFVIVDITNPRSAPLELQATVPECMVPFVPILDKNDEQKPFAMLRDLQIAHRDRVFDVIRYPSVDRLIEVLDTEIISPAQARFAELLALKREGVRYRDV
jgi:hypothetical protein